MSEHAGGQIALYSLGRQQGRAIWFLGTLTFVKATTDQTRGAFGLIEQLLPAGRGSPYHVHHKEDEAFYILEGQCTFISSDRSFQATAGSYVFLPRDIPHGFRADTPSRILVLATPGGFEQFVVEAGEPATRLELPPSQEPDVEKLVSVAAKYGIEILGPLPEIE